jgi:uncharacterized protein YndB with AHSA1/START domain
MATYSITVEIDAPPDRVWAIMSDIERWPEWTSSVTSVERLDTGPLAVGSRARVRQPKLLPADFVVTDFDPGSAFTWVTRSAGVTATARHSVVPSGRGSRATLSVEFHGALGWLVGWAVGGLTNRYLALEAAGLKERSEIAD